LDAFHGAMLGLCLQGYPERDTTRIPPCARRTK
jgi:hypothetical protein